MDSMRSFEPLSFDDDELVIARGIDQDELALVHGIDLNSPDTVVGCFTDEFNPITDGCTDEAVPAQLRYKIDYYTSVWESSSIRDVLSFLGLSNCLDGFLSSGYHVYDAVYATSLKLVYNGILLELPYEDIVLMQKPVEDILQFDHIKDFKFSKIRLSLSGTALDFLRSTGLDVEDYLRQNPEDLQLPYHVTRCDFAFDFINFHGDFLQKCFEFVDNPAKILPSGRLAIIGVPGGVSFKTVRGSQRTFYLGAPTSERYLRIYDKKLERAARNGGVFMDTQFGDPAAVKSWIRFEWQLRKDKARTILYGSGGDNFYMAVLREIFEFYSFRDCETSNTWDKKIEVAPFWRDFFDWSGIDSLSKLLILHNFESKAKQVKTFVECHAKRQLLLYVQLYKEAGLLQLIRQSWADLVTPMSDANLEFIRQKQLRSFIRDLNMCGNGDISSIRPGILDTNNQLVYPRYDIC